MTRLRFLDVPRCNREQLHNFCLVYGKLYYIHSDSRGQLKSENVPFQDATFQSLNRAAYKKTTSIQIPIECAYMEVNSRSTAVEFRQNFIILQSPVLDLHMIFVLYYSTGSYLYSTAIFNT